jgi:uncharacterized protein YndB with AHSA1/START domain
MTHTDRGSAVVRAPVDAVFAALMDAERRAAWLPPSGMTGRFERFDARPGGGYRMVLSYDDKETRGKTEGNHDVVEARFGAIEPPSLVVELVDFVSEDPGLAGTMTMTWSLEPHDAGTLVTITATDVPDAVASSDHEVAFASTLANLARHLVG